MSNGTVNFLKNEKNCITIITYVMNRRIKNKRNEDVVMDAVSVTLLFLGLFSGIALFLYGMSVMGDGLKKVAGNKLETLLYGLTSTPLKGILLGAGVTAIIQSSSATSVMVVGFVNSGMMKVVQGIGIIMGANIGTSITGWILCLSDIQGAGGVAALLSSSSIAAIVAIVGLFVRNLSKKETHKAIGDIMFGFTILMIGMSTMKEAMAPLQDNPFLWECSRSFPTLFLEYFWVLLLLLCCRVRPRLWVFCSLLPCRDIFRFQRRCL